MEKTQQTNATITQQTKHCVWWGLLLGSLVGLALAFRSVWVADMYIQKGLSLITLEIFSQRMLAAGFVSLVAFLMVGPGLLLVSQKFREIGNLNVARLLLIVFGVVAVTGGYYLNKTTWFLPILSLAGILINGLFCSLCYVVGFGFYKLFRSLGMKVPTLGAKLFRSLYSNIGLALLLVAFIGFNSYAYWRVSAQKPAGPNLLIITIDTLRADRLSCYGYDRETSPAIDTIAKDGVLFSQAFSQRGLTWPSLTSIMTSLYPKTHGVLSNQLPLDGQHATLAEILKNVGYKTGAFIANFYYAPNRGFDVKKGGEVGNLDKTVTRDALDWLEKINPADDKFFMWVHYKNPHDPYEPPAPFSSFFDSTYTGPFDGSRAVLDSIYVNKIDLGERDLGYLNALYDAEIRSSDSYIQRLLDRLEEKGLTDNTLIVFSSDHGEEMYEHNQYFFHSCSMYDGVLHIPLIMKFPEILPVAKVIPNQVESIDITPTILEFLKVPLREEFEGRSLLPVIYGEVNGAWRPAFSERASSIFAIRTPEWKYIYNPDNYHTYCSRSDDDQGDGYLIEAEELYHLPTDPKEQDNVVADHHDVAIELRAQIIEWLNTNKREHKAYTLSKEAEERLRALGYIK